MIPVFCFVPNCIPSRDLVQALYIVMSICIALCSSKFPTSSAVFSAASGMAFGLPRCVRHWFDYVVLFETTPRYARLAQPGLLYPDTTIRHALANAQPTGS